MPINKSNTNDSVESNVGAYRRNKAFRLSQLDHKYKALLAHKTGNINIRDSADSTLEKSYSQFFKSDGENAIKSDSLNNITQSTSKKHVNTSIENNTDPKKHVNTSIENNIKSSQQSSNELLSSSKLESVIDSKQINSMDSNIDLSQSDNDVRNTLDKNSPTNSEFEVTNFLSLLGHENQDETRNYSINNVKSEPNTGVNNVITNVVEKEYDYSTNQSNGTPESHSRENTRVNNFIPNIVEKDIPDQEYLTNQTPESIPKKQFETPSRFNNSPRTQHQHFNSTMMSFGENKRLTFAQRIRESIELSEKTQRNRGNVDTRRIDFSFEQGKGSGDKVGKSIRGSKEKPVRESTEGTKDNVVRKSALGNKEKPVRKSTEGSKENIVDNTSVTKTQNKSSNIRQNTTRPMHPSKPNISEKKPVTNRETKHHTFPQKIEQSKTNRQNPTSKLPVNNIDQKASVQKGSPLEQTRLLNLRKKLEKLQYNFPLEIGSIDLVETLLSDLLRVVKLNRENEIGDRGISINRDIKDRHEKGDIKDRHEKGDIKDIKGIPISTQTIDTVDTIKIMENKINELVFENQNLIAKNKEIETSGILNSSVTNDSILAEIEEINNRNALLEKELAESRQNHLKFITRMKAEKKELKDDLSIKSSKLQRQTMKITSLEDQVHNLEQTIIELNQDIDDTSEKILSREEENVNLKEKCENLQQKLLKINENYKHLGQDVEQICHKNNNIQEKLVDRDGQIEKLKNENIKLHNEIKENSQTVLKLETQIQNLTQTISTMGEEIDHNLKTYDELHSKYIKMTNVELPNLKRENKSLINVNKGLEKEVSRINEVNEGKLQKYKVDYETISSQLQTLVSVCDEVEIERERFRSELLKLNGEKENLVLNLEKMTSELESLNLLVSEKDKSINQLQWEHSEKVKEIDFLKKQNLKIQNDQNSLEMTNSRIKEIEEENLKIQRELASSTMDRKVLLKQIEDGQMEIDKLYKINLQHSDQSKKSIEHLKILESDFNKVCLENQELFNQIDELKIQISKMENIEKMSKIDIEKSHREYEEIAIENEHLHEAFMNMTDRQQLLSSQLEKLNRELERSNEEQLVKNDQIQEYIQIENGLKDEIKLREVEISTLHREINNLHLKIENFEFDKSLIVKEYDKKIQDFRVIESLYHQGEVKCAKTESFIQDVNFELDQMKRDNDKLNREILLKNSEIEELRNNVNRLEGVIADLRSRAVLSTTAENYSKNSDRMMNSDKSNYPNDLVTPQRNSTTIPHSSEHRYQRIKLAESRTPDISVIAHQEVSEIRRKRRETKKKHTDTSSYREERRRQRKSSIINNIDLENNIDNKENNINKENNTDTMDNIQNISIEDVTSSEVNPSSTNLDLSPELTGQDISTNDISCLRLSSTGSLRDSINSRRSIEFTRLKEEYKRMKENMSHLY